PDAALFPAPVGRDRQLGADASRPAKIRRRLHVRNRTVVDRSLSPSRGGDGLHADDGAEGWGGGVALRERRPGLVGGRPPALAPGRQPGRRARRRLQRLVLQRKNRRGDDLRTGTAGRRAAAGGTVPEAEIPPQLRDGLS